MTVNGLKLESFQGAYVIAALWSSTDGEKALDKDYGANDIHSDTLAKMVADCDRFLAENADLITDDNLLKSLRGNTTDEYAGRDFWFTRNGHGCGFWDGDWEEDAGEKLTAASKAFSEFFLYVGDDGLIYGQ